jgi:lipopolysaccharide heptosyltransferase II
MDDESSTFLDVSPRRILVVKLSSLGDIVHTLPAVSAIRKRFSSAHVSWLVKSQWASILEGNPDVDEVLPVDVSWRNWPRLIRDLRQRQCDLVLDFQGLFRTGFLGIVSGAARRVGFARAREGAPWMYTHRVPLPGEHESSWRLLAMHAVDRNLAIARFLGADISRPIFHLPGLAEDEEFICDLLHGAEVEDHTQLIALAPWSRSALKSWPLSRFVELAEELIRSSTFRVVVLGGPSELGSAKAFRRLQSQGLVNLVGKLLLRQLPSLLRRMKLVVGNDSSLIHLAAGLETPVLAIFGPTEPRATGPYPFTRHSVRRTELPCSPCGQRTCRNPIYLECLHSISVSSVLESMREMMVPHI